MPTGQSDGSHSSTEVSLFRYVKFITKLSCHKCFKGWIDFMCQIYLIHWRYIMGIYLTHCNHIVGKSSSTHRVHSLTLTLEKWKMAVVDGNPYKAETTRKSAKTGHHLPSSSFNVLLSHNCTQKNSLSCCRVTRPGNPRLPSPSVF